MREPHEVWKPGDAPGFFSVVRPDGLALCATSYRDTPRSLAKSGFMSNRLTQALLLLQRMAYARILCEFHRQRQVRAGSAVSPPELATACRRLRVCEAHWESCRAELVSSEMASAVRVARALHLRRLLDSAAVRLAPWHDRSDLAHIPASHLLEWVSHDCERLELAELEDAMTPEETALYGHSLESLLR